MRTYILYILTLTTIFLSSCGKDNYNEPDSNLIGKIVSTSTGENIGVRETDGSVQMQLWQDGYELYTPISVYVNQDGTFSAKLFNGTYKLVTRDNNGPWVNDRDTVVVTVAGTTTVTYPVKPYFMLRDENFKVTGNKLTATFRIEQITASQNHNIEEVILYVSSTRFLDSGYNKKTEKISNPVIGNNSVSMDLTSLASYPILYARIGVKITGVEQMLYTTGSVAIK